MLLALITAKRASSSILMLIAALACSPSSALARGGAGHNPATKKLEDAFKAALYVRSVSPNGCYPPAPQLAKTIAPRKKGLRTGVARGPGSVQRRNIVYVLSSGSACNHIRMALLASLRPLCPQLGPGEHPGAGQAQRAAQRSGAERSRPRRLT